MDFEKMLTHLFVEEGLVVAFAMVAAVMWLSYVVSKRLTPVRALAGGTAAWIAAGLPLETGARPATVVDDVYRRPYEGADNPAEAMQAYLEWEYGLVDQLARDASHGFHVI